jgi:hypothetical protein
MVSTAAFCAVPLFLISMTTAYTSAQSLGGCISTSPVSSFLICRAGLRTLRSFVGENEIASSTSVLIVTFFFGDCFKGVRDVVSRFRFRDEPTSSISAGGWDSSILVEAELFVTNLETDERVDRLVWDVALINWDVSCAILEVRIMRL